ncbi:sulfatase-like hydrolase/transferase [Luteolibacter pohnpeiensis]|uniref:Sulfatase-like hydrolase/transferase n=1 Tax=Luteolibacter pohnpeiensis TaxID=454153 RepID=A0A934S989_9BACT|nr:sulfatase-like hydrolase/transferase [Luteolibacter pohnpeiensis]MBK1884158.1 sulfatase-like hydrolase/transferase [Luteolibacter pohnpeiensis]
MLRILKKRPSRLARTLLAFSCIFLTASAKDKPNVIFILSDDLGAADLGCYGTKDVHTPAADSIAEHGVRFTQFYSGAPICSPSRACLLTGRYPFRAGVTGNIGFGRGVVGMPAKEITMAKVFKDAGYQTAHIGKWHLGFTDQTSPNAKGFDYSFGHMGGCIDNYSHFFYWSGPNVHDLYRNGTEVYESGEYFPDLMLKEADHFITENRNKPFFIYYAMNTPHYPYQGEKKWLDYFKDLKYPRNLYSAFLASQDDRIAKLLARIDELGLTKDTIIIFQSDNGYSTEERAHHGGGNSGPYRGAKYSLFEGGIRLPAIISYPGHLPQGEVRDQMVHAADWMPTLAELCGLKLPKVKLDGTSILPVIKSASAPSPHTSLQWKIGQGKSTSWAVREGDWKLMSNVFDPVSGKHIPMFLANIKEDIGEQNNLFEKHPDVVLKLTQEHEELMKEIHD